MKARLVLALLLAACSLPGVAAAAKVTAIVGATVLHPELEGAAAVARDTTILIADNRKLANLVVLDADPLADLANLSRASYVFRDGRAFRPAELMQPLREPTGT